MAMAMATTTSFGRMAVAGAICGEQQKRNASWRSRPGRWEVKQLCRIASLATEKRLEVSVRLGDGFGGGGGGGPCIRLPQSRRGRLNGVRIAAISSVDDEFRGGADSTGAESFTEDEDVTKVGKIDLQLPRRRLLVEFTCNVCQTRTQRLVNPEAYKRGTVYVQCGGCEVYHQLVDNLNLVVEYDLREDTDSKSS